MVPCSGLYADVTDDSHYQALEENIMKGIVIQFHWLFYMTFLPGLRALTRRLDEYNEGLDLGSELEQLFSTPMKEDDKFLRLLTERYMNYKVNYVKHLLFNPDTQNMSKLIIFFKLNIYVQLVSF